MVEEALVKLNKSELHILIKSLITVNNLNGVYDEDLKELLGKLSETAINLK